MSRAGDTRGAEQVAAEILLAKEPGARKLLRAIARAGTGKQRRTALAALLRRADDRFVGRYATVDKSPAVRRHIAKRYRELGRTGVAVRAVAPLLHCKNPRDRVLAAEMLESLGNVAALPHLVRALRGSNPSAKSPRVYVSVVNQKSYVRDFDVEIASRSFIADPKTNVAHEGAVLAVRELHTSVRRTLIRVVGKLQNVAKAEKGRAEQAKAEKARAGKLAAAEESANADARVAAKKSAGR